MSAPSEVTAIALVCIATVLIGTFALRFSRTTSDFYVASRSVSPWWNASAIGGEYLSAASFLGIAGLMKEIAAGDDFFVAPAVPLRELAAILGIAEQFGLLLFLDISA